MAVRVRTDWFDGRPREITWGAERLSVVKVAAVREETSAYKVAVGPRTVFEVDTPRARLPSSSGIARGPGRSTGSTRPAPRPDPPGSAIAGSPCGGRPDHARRRDRRGARPVALPRTGPGPARGARAGTALVPGGRPTIGPWQRIPFRSASATWRWARSSTARVRPIRSPGVAARRPSPVVSRPRSSRWYVALHRPAKLRGPRVHVRVDGDRGHPPFERLLALADEDARGLRRVRRGPRSLGIPKPNATPDTRPPGRGPRRLRGPARLPRGVPGCRGGRGGAGRAEQRQCRERRPRCCAARRGGRRGSRRQRPDQSPVRRRRGVRDRADGARRRAPARVARLASRAREVVAPERSASRCWRSPLRDARLPRWA